VPELYPEQYRRSHGLKTGGAASSGENWAKARTLTDCPPTVIARSMRVREPARNDRWKGAPISKVTERKHRIPEERKGKQERTKWFIFKRANP
jgi:hypothetical protein